MASSQKTTESALHKLFKNPGAFSSGDSQDEWEAFLLESLDQISTPLAAKMLAQIGLLGGGDDTEKNASARVEPFTLLDNGCGFGVVAPLLQRSLDPDVLSRSKIVSADYSEKLVEFVRRRIEREGWVSTEAKVLDAQNTGLPSQSFTHVVSNIMFHTVPDSEAALKESIRLLKPGGTLAFTTWHAASPGWIVEMREAFAAFPFDAPFHMAMQTTKWGDWANPNWVRDTLTAQGLEDVRVDVLGHLGHVKSADDFVRGFDMMLLWMMDANWSEELRRAHPAEEVRGLLRGFLERKYQGRAWDLTWLSIVASGRVKNAC